MSVKDIRITEIHTETRLRGLNVEKVAELAASITEIGTLLQPIVIRPNGHGYKLVAGAHRLEAFRRLGRECIPANVVSLDDLEAELAEIDENLMRNELAVMERGEHLARRQVVYEQLHPETRQGGDRRSQESNGNNFHLKSFADDAAEKLGVTPRTVRQEIQIANDIAPQVKDKIRGHDIADTKTELLKLARLDEATQNKVADAITSGEAATVEEALKPQHHRTQFTGENEWYTPTEHLEAVRAFLGGIDLDPASSEAAQKKVKAKRYYTAEDDGLAQEWRGRVWLNPPYSQPLIAQFVEKMVAEVKAGHVTEAVMLTHNYTDTAWFHLAESVCSAICFTRGRIKFYNADGEIAAPTQGQAFFYYGPRVKEFRQAFKQFGFIR